MKPPPNRVFTNAIGAVSIKPRNKCENFISTALPAWPIAGGKGCCMF